MQHQNNNTTDSAVTSNGNNTNLNTNYEFTFANVTKFKPADYQQAIMLPPPLEGNYFGDTVQTYSNNNNNAAAQQQQSATKIPHGKGVSISSDGQTRFGGFWNRGKRHGRGTFVSPGFDYDGEWWEDAMHGRCFQMRYKSAGGIWGAIKSLRSQPKEYSGEIHRDHGVHGRGKMIFTNGEVYDGEWYQGKRNGRGVQATQEGERYEGQFENDSRHGTGVLALASGAQYLGMFHNGRRHGHGKMLRQNGDIYIGDFNMDEMQGNGVMTYKNGDTYSGEWKYNTRHGRGIFKLAEKGALVSGTFVSGLLQGDGTVEIPGKSIFIGEFLHGERVFGTMWLDGPSSSSASTTTTNKNTNNNVAAEISPQTNNDDPSSIPPPVPSLPPTNNNINQQNNNNFMLAHNNPGAGGVYHGPFKGDGVHGKGLFWYPDGSFYAGDWFNGKRQGEGYMRHVDGTEYSGEFFADERHGRGFLKLPSGNKNFQDQHHHHHHQSTNHNNNTTSSLNPHIKMIACGIFDTDSSITVGYFGEWDSVRNELCGRGTFIEENGAVYEGLFHRSKRELLGSITVPVILDRMTNENDDKNINYFEGNSDPAATATSNDINSNVPPEFKNWPNMVTAILSRFGAARSKALKNFFSEMVEGNSGDFAEMLIKQRDAAEKQKQLLLNNAKKSFKQQDASGSETSGAFARNDDDRNKHDDDQQNDDNDDLHGSSSSSSSPERKFHLVSDYGPNGKKSTVAVHTVHLRIRGSFASSSGCRVHHHSQLEPPSRKINNANVTPEEFMQQHQQKQIKQHQQQNNNNSTINNQNDDNDENDNENDLLNTTTRVVPSRNINSTSNNNNNNVPVKSSTKHQQQTQISCYIGGTSSASPTFRLVYRGGFVADAAHGEGTLVLEDEKGNQIACYCGLFAGGEPCGSGVVTGAMSGNRFFSGDWLRGRPAGSGLLYDRGTDVSSPFPEVPVQSSNAIMRLLTMRAHNQAEAEAARLARLRRGIHRLPHIIQSEWYGGETHGNSTVFLLASSSSSSSTSSSCSCASKIISLPLLHGMPRLVFPHAPKEVTAPTADSRPDETCRLCGLAYGLLRVPVRCRCCVRVGCTTCCETAQLPPHVPTVLLDEITHPGQVVKVRHDDRMAAIRHMTLSQEHHIFDRYFGKSGDSDSASASAHGKDTAAALYKRSHLASSAALLAAKEKFTTSARICEMCSCAIEEHLTKVSLFEEADEETILCLDDHADDDDHKKEPQDTEVEDDFVLINHQNSSTSSIVTAFIPLGSNSDATNKTQQEQEIVSNLENEHYYRKLTSSFTSQQQTQTNSKKILQKKIVKSYSTGFCDKDGLWTDICSVWNRVALNLCQNPKVTAALVREAILKMNGGIDDESKKRVSLEDDNTSNSLISRMTNIPTFDLSPQNTTASRMMNNNTNNNISTNGKNFFEQQQHLASLNALSALSPSLSFVPLLSNILTSSEVSPSDVQYYGSMHRSKRNGLGTLILNYLDGEGYRGHWKNDLRDGQGIYRFPVHRCEELLISSSASPTTTTIGNSNSSENTENSSLPEIDNTSSNDNNNNTNNNSKNSAKNNNKNPQDQQKSFIENEWFNDQVTSYVGVSGDWLEGKLIRLRYRGEINPKTWQAQGKGVGFLYEEHTHQNDENPKNNTKDQQSKFATKQHQQLVEVYNGDWKNGQPHGVGIVTVVVPEKSTDKSNSSSTSASSKTYTANYQQESQFIGFFQNGKRHGPGKSLSPSTATITHGTWKNGTQEGNAQIEHMGTSSMFGVMNDGLLEGAVWEQFLLPVEVSAVALQDSFERQMKQQSSSSSSFSANSPSSSHNKSESEKSNSSEKIVDAGELLLNRRTAGGGGQNSNASPTVSTAKLTRRLLFFSNGTVNTESVTQADELGKWALSTTTSCSFCGYSFGFLASIWTQKSYCRCCARVGCTTCLAKLRTLPEHLNPVAPTKEENADDFATKQHNHHQVNDAKNDQQSQQEKNKDATSSSSTSNNNNHNNNTAQKSSQKLHPVCEFCDSFMNSGVAFGALHFEDGLVYCGHIETKLSDCTLPHPDGFGLWYRSNNIHENVNGNGNDDNDEKTGRDSAVSTSSIYVCGSPFAWRRTATSKEGANTIVVIKSHQEREYSFTDFETWWNQMLFSFNIDASSSTTEQEQSSNLRKVLSATSNVPSCVRVPPLSLPNPRDIGVKLHPISSATGVEEKEHHFFTQKSTAAIQKLREISLLKKRIRFEKEKEREALKEKQRELNAQAAQSGIETSEIDLFFKKEAKLKLRVEKQRLMDDFLSKMMPKIVTSKNDDEQQGSIKNEIAIFPQYCRLFVLPPSPDHPEPRPTDPRPLTQEEVEIALRNARLHAAEQLGLASISSVATNGGVVVATSNENITPADEVTFPGRNQNQQGLFQQTNFFHTNNNNNDVFFIGPTPPPAPPLRVPFTNAWNEWDTKILPRNCLPRHLMPAIDAAKQKRLLLQNYQSHHNNNSNNGKDSLEHESDESNKNNNNDLFVDPLNQLHNPFLLPGSEGCLTSANASMVDSPNFSPPPISFLEKISVPSLTSSHVFVFDGNSDSNSEESKENVSKTTEAWKLVPEIFGLRIILEHSRDGVGAPIKLEVVDDNVITGSAEEAAEVGKELF